MRRGLVASFAARSRVRCAAGPPSGSPTEVLDWGKKQVEEAGETAMKGAQDVARMVDEHGKGAREMMAGMMHPWVKQKGETFAQEIGNTVFGMTGLPLSVVRKDQLEKLHEELTKYEAQAHAPGSPAESGQSTPPAAEEKR